MSDLAVMRGFLPQITAENIERIEHAALNLPQVACDVVHRFGPGLYIREVFIPAGTFAIGHYQKYEHMNVFLKGRVMMVKEDGSVAEMVAPMSFVGKPGRKIGYIMEDMYWQNIYATDEQDIETLERLFFDKDAVFSDHCEQRLAIESALHERDRLDYAAMLEETGISAELAESQAFSEEDRIDLPFDSYKIMVSASPIHGKGLFATGEVREGDIIAPSRLSGKRTQAGRYTNHSAHPNALMVSAPDGDIYLVASRDIKGLHGGLPVDEITVDYRQAIAECCEASKVKICQQSQPLL